MQVKFLFGGIQTWILGKTALILESDYSPISKSDEVYRCETTDAVLLHDDSGQNIGSLFISNVTMQAFGIQKGNFSEKGNMQHLLLKINYT